MIIQPVINNDLKILCDIEKRCFAKDAYTENYLSFLLRMPNSVSLVAKVDQTIIGFIIGLSYDSEKLTVGHICTLDVSMEHRRRGVGSKLIDEVERIFVKRNISICYLEVSLENLAARNFYRKHEYVEVQALKDYYSRGKHGIRLVKKLL